MQLIDFAQRNGDTLLLYCGPEDIGFKVSFLPEITREDIQALQHMVNAKENFHILVNYDIKTQVIIVTETRNIKLEGEDIEVTKL